jgi:two-component system cell cycle sensor histidine kinase/response regulator CckA
MSLVLFVASRNKQKISGKSRRSPRGLSTSAYKWERNRIIPWLQAKQIREKQRILTIASVVITLAGVFVCSKYIFHSALRPDQVAGLVALLGILFFVLERRNLEKATTPNAPPDSGKLLEQSQKMEAIGRLAGGVAHDFNNLLAVITGYSDLLLESLGPSDVNRAKVEHIKQAASSAASLTRQLLMFSRQQVIQPVVLDINQTVGNTEKMLRRLIKENIEFTVSLDPGLDRVKADPGQIEQIVLNLVVNARDAMPNGGKLRIQTKNVRLDSSSVSLGPGTQSGQFVLLEVADTGTGMDQHTRAHIFEPFFTTKATGQGTGLGLATVYGIVKQSNGHIEVQSALGQGSSFKIYFPLAERRGERHQSSEIASKTVFLGETVLVVEDAKPLRDLICEALRRSGCTVLSAHDAQEALGIINQRQSVIDLLLTDVVMPGMNGSDLAKKVRSLSPPTKILYMTGYSGEFIRGDMLTPGVSFIQKPFTPADLAQKVSKMLADREAPAAKTAAAGTSS